LDRSGTVQDFRSIEFTPLAWYKWIPTFWQELVVLLSHCCLVYVFAVCYVLIHCFIILIHFVFVFLSCMFCFLFSAFFVFVLFCVLFLPMSIVVYFLFVYKFTNHCHWVETQLQLINIIIINIQY